MPKRWLVVSTASVSPRMRSRPVEMASAAVVGSRPSSANVAASSKATGYAASSSPAAATGILVDADRVARLDVRATMRTHDGALVYVATTGRALLSDEATGRFLAGETIGAQDMYACTAPLFETGADAYAWLNSTVTIAVNKLSLHHVHYRVYQAK